MNRANSKLELDDSREVTWSAAVGLSLTTTPRTRRLDQGPSDSLPLRLDTRSMSSRGGRSAVFGLAVKMISFVFYSNCYPPKMAEFPSYDVVLFVIFIKIQS